MTVEPVGGHPARRAKDRTATYRLIRVVAKTSSTCPPVDIARSSGGPTIAPGSCTPDRSELLDLVPIDGRGWPRQFKPCPTCARSIRHPRGTKNKNIVFFPDPKPTSTTAPIVIATAQALNLIRQREIAERRGTAGSERQRDRQYVVAHDEQPRSSPRRPMVREVFSRSSIFPPNGIHPRSSATSPPRSTASAPAPTAAGST